MRFGLLTVAFALVTIFRPAPSESVTSPPTTYRFASVRLRRTVVAVALVAVTYLYLLRLSFTYFPDADSASDLLAASDMAHGNWGLRGWILPQNSYWLTDLPLYALGTALTGTVPLLLYVVPAVIYLGLLALVTVTISERSLLGLVAVVPLLFPSDLLGYIALRSTYHVATTLFVLGSFFLMHHALRNHRVLVIPAVLALAAGVASDPLALAIGVVPAISASVLLRHRLPAAVAVAAFLIAKVTTVVLHVFGLVLVNLTPHVVFSGLGSRLATLAETLLELFGGNVFREASLAVVVRLLGGLVVLGAVGWGLRKARRRADVLSVLLALSMVVLVGAFIFNSAINDQSAWASFTKGRVVEPVVRSLRYLNPAVVFGCILLGRAVGRIRPKTGLVLASVAIGAIYAVTPVTRLVAPPNGAYVGNFLRIDLEWPSIIALGTWLRAHHLREGYGSYWDAASVSLATERAVRVLPIYADRSGIRPLMWNVNCGWFEGDGATFLVYRRVQDFYGLSWHNQSSPGAFLAAATRTFGPPTMAHSVAQYEVLQWDHIIHVPLHPSPDSPVRATFQRFVGKGVLPPKACRYQ